LLGASSEDDHRKIRERLRETSQRLQSKTVRKPQVEKSNINPMLPGVEDALLQTRGVGEEEGKLLSLQKPSQQESVGTAVLDKKN
jgi:hypothetical protein